MTSVDREHPLPATEHPPPSAVEQPRFMRFIDYFIASFTHPHQQHAAGHARIVCVCVCRVVIVMRISLNLSLVPQVVALCAPLPLLTLCSF